MNRNFDVLELDALLDSTSILMARIFEAIADLSEMPGYKPEMLTPFNPLLRAWNVQMEGALEELERHQGEGAAGRDPGSRNRPVGRDVLRSLEHEEKDDTF
jgi:hypothetical protein